MQRHLFALSFCLVTNGRPPLMSTIELVDPELRDALAQQLPPLTAESLRQRRANALELAGAVPKPNLPDIATDEIHVESAFGAKPIRVLIYPMIDDRTAVRKDLHPYVGEFVWTQENNYFGWRSLLGEEPGTADVSPYAAAARAADVSGLPPTYISVGGLDLFLEENMIYADRLSRAGVPVELHMYPRAYHGFYRVTNARVTKQGEHDNREALRRFLHG